MKILEILQIHWDLNIYSAPYVYEFDFFDVN